MRRTTLPALLAAALVLALALPARADDPRRTPVVLAVERVSPAVVNITTSRVVQAVPDPFGGAFSGPAYERFLREFGIERMPRKAQSLGSGVIIDGARGFVLTNAHVINGATEISVRLKDGRELAAQVKGSDPDRDLAVLQVERAGSLPQAEMGDSTDLLIGETVIAIGNPYGFTHTVTTGVISAVGRSVGTSDEVLSDLIQTDTAINPGNSGGPLLNILGQVIGINTAIHAEASGIGFAIPINKAKRVVAELINQGHVTPVWLGLFGQDLDQPTASYLGLKSPRGLLVTDLHAGGPAQRAGLAPGDVILTLNGRGVDDRDHFLSLMLDVGPGDSVRLGVSRQGREMTLQAKAQALDDAAVAALVDEHWGFAADPRRPRTGILVGRVAPNGPAARIGLKPGDILHQIGNQSLETPDDLARAFTRYHLHNTLLLSVQRGRALYHVRMAL